MNDFVFKLKKEKFYEMDFNGNTKIYSIFIGRLKFRVKNPKKYI